MEEANYPKEGVSFSQIKELVEDKIVLITGGTGALGNALIERLLPLKAKEIRVFSRDERKQDEVRKKYSEQCKYILGDVKDYHSIRDAVRGVNIVIHAAAFKYLDIAEQQPMECIKTNVIGSINVINAVKDEKNIEICLAISTDKASAPINVYGMSKSMMERLFCEAERTKSGLKTKFLTVRYGNVLMTTGSVVPKWKKAQESGEEIKVTDPTMTRFMFTLGDSIDLIFYSLINGQGGDIISVKMPAVLMGDLAKTMSKGEVPVKVIGFRPGEKKHECLIADFELKDTIDVGNNFVIRPHSNIGLQSELGVQKSFTSEDAKILNEKEIIELLSKVGAITETVKTEEH